MNDDNLKILKDTFRTTKNINNLIDLKKMYIGMLKNIFGSLDVIKSQYKTDSKNKKKKNLINSFNIELIEKLFKVGFKIGINDFDDNLLKTLNINKPSKKIMKIKMIVMIFKY